MMRADSDTNPGKPRRARRHVAFRLDDSTDATGTSSNDDTCVPPCTSSHSSAQSSLPSRSHSLRSDCDCNLYHQNNKSTLPSSSLCDCSSWSRASRAETDALRELAMERGRDMARVVSGLGFEVVTRPGSNMTWLATPPRDNMPATCNATLRARAAELRCQACHNNYYHGTRYDDHSDTHGDSDDHHPSSYCDRTRGLDRDEKDYNAPSAASVRATAASAAPAECSIDETRLMASWNDSCSESRTGSEFSCWQDALLVPFFADELHIVSSAAPQPTAPVCARAASQASTLTSTTTMAPMLCSDTEQDAVHTESSCTPVLAAARATSEEHDTDFVEESSSGQTLNAYNYVLHSARSYRSNSSDSSHSFNRTNTIVRLCDSALDNISATIASSSSSRSASSATNNNDGHWPMRNNINHSSIIATTLSGRVPINVPEIIPRLSPLSALM